MSYVWYPSKSLDVLDTAISYSLDCHCFGWTNFTREEPALGRVTYKLHREDLGSLGEIELRKLDEGKTVLEVRRPKTPPRREFTPEELWSIRLLDDEEAKHRTIVEIHRKIRAERKQQHQLLLEHHRLTIECLAHGLKVAGIENVVPTREPSVGPSEDRPKWFPKKPTTRARWREAYELMCELDSIYEGRYEDFGQENPNPKRADYAAYLFSEMNWRLSEKTVGHIKQAGVGGWLE